MKCQFCGRDLEVGRRGKRRREYCNDACKQAAYRRRHPASERGQQLRKELAQAKWRMRELERFIHRSGLILPEQRQVEPVDLWEFAGRHSVDRKRVMDVVEQKMLHPVDQSDTLLLDGEGQGAFWRIFHGYSLMWRSCPDCPHGNEERQTGAHDQCGACNRLTKEVYKDTGASYGYLCLECYRLVQSFQGDPSRMRGVLGYLIRSRGRS